MSAQPMFPLGTALLPGEVLPLRIFEPRYRTMLDDCLAAADGPPGFGVVLIAVSYTHLTLPTKRIV